MRKPTPPPIPPAATAAIRTLKISAQPEASGARIGTTLESGQMGAAPPASASVTDELKARAERERTADPLTASRVWIEVSLQELHGHRKIGDAKSSLKRSLALAPGTVSALGRARRLLRSKPDGAELVQLLDEELKHQGDAAIRASLLLERARLVDLAGNTSDARSTLEGALSFAPGHPLVLRALEVSLRRSLVARWNDSDATQLAALLGTMAHAVDPEHAAPEDVDPRLAARFLVEQGQILDRIPGEVERAKAVLERAVSLEPWTGPTRAALNDFLLRRGDEAALASSLAAESEHEKDDARAVRLLFHAARILTEVCKRPEDAITLLDRASKRLSPQLFEPRHGETGARVLAELGRLLEARGSERDAAEVLERWLSTIRDDEALAHEHTRIVEIFESLGRFDRAAEHARSVVALRPTDIAARNRLDRILRRLGGNRERVSVWASLAGTEATLLQQVAGLRRAARILEAELGKRDDAIAHLRSAWVLDPGNGDVFDDLIALLSPRHDGAAESEPARARIELLEGAARVASEPDRRLAILEKLVSLWEDELGRPDRALEVIDQILHAEPERRSAVLALQRNAKRAGNYTQLSRGLQIEARQTKDSALRRRLLLRAAEVTEAHLGDQDRARLLLDEAVAVESKDPTALIARFAHHQRARRFDAARADLQALARLEKDAAQRAGLWIDVAILDEHGRKNSKDAVTAYLAAAEAHPALVVPRREIARILRGTGDVHALIDALKKLADGAKSAATRTSLLLEAAEIQELVLRDPASALASLALADQDPSVTEPAVAEAQERLLRRTNARVELATMLQRRLEQDPSASQAARWNLSMAEALEASEPARASTVLQGLTSIESIAISASRALVHVQRATRSAGLSKALELELGLARSRFTRAGILLELVDESERGGGSSDDATLLERLVAEVGLDTGILERLSRSLVAPVDPSAEDPARAARLLTALRARKGMTEAPVERALFELEEALIADAFATLDASWSEAAHAGFSAALSLWPESLLAARGLERTSMRLSDRLSLRASQIALARVVDGARARARHLVAAAELSVSAETGDTDDAQNLYLEALRTDPDAHLAARALVPLLDETPSALIAAFGQALEKATDPTQIALLGTEVAMAVLQSTGTEHPSDPTLGVSAMRRVIGVSPKAPLHRMLLARTLVAAQVWHEAREIFEQLARSDTQDLRVDALFELATLHTGALHEPAKAREALLAVLELTPDDPRALEGLLRVATSEGRRDLVAFALQRLVDTATEPGRRVEMALRLAEARRADGDLPSAESALREAVVAAPLDTRPWTALRSLYRTDGPDGAAAFASALNSLIALATSRNVRLEPRWLTTLGLLEAAVLRRPNEALLHLEQAVRLPSANADTRIALGRGLELIGRSSEAIQILREVLTRDAETFASLSDLVSGLESLDSALAREGRGDEHLAVEEARACVGFVPPERVASLRARPALTSSVNPGSLVRELLDDLRVPEARDPALEIGIVVMPVLGKVLRFDLANLSIGSKDRVGPRDAHPVRALADRLARALGIEAFELYLSPSWQGPLRAFPGDPPVLVGPTSITSLPELEQAFAIAQELARIAVGTVGLDDLPPADADGLLIGALRAVERSFGEGEISPARDEASQPYLAAFERHIGRRQRRRIEEILPTILPKFDVTSILAGARQTELRAAYVLTGSLISSLDYLRRIDVALASANDAATLIRNPLASTVFRFSLTADAFKHRRRVGTLWS